MPAATYSYLDVAVLDPVRERFAAGDAVLILSTDLQDVIWVNGPGARLFGESDIEAAIGGGAGLGFAARRQIMSTRGFPRIGRDRPITIRLNQGLTSLALGFAASAITLPDGEDAILLALPAESLRGAAVASARQAISGFTQPGHLVALLDGRGAIEAASDGFADLGISPQTLTDLARAASRQPDRLVKKIISGDGARYPAGIARLRDEPARHLLMIVDERRAEIAAEDEAGREVGAAEPALMIGPMAEAPTDASENRASFGRHETIDPKGETAAEPASDRAMPSGDQPRRGSTALTSGEAEAPEPAAASSEPGTDRNAPFDDADDAAVGMPDAEEPAGHGPSFELIAESIPDAAADGRVDADETVSLETSTDLDTAQAPSNEPQEQDRQETTRPDFVDADTPPAEAIVTQLPETESSVRPSADPAPPVDDALASRETPAAPVRFVWRTDAAGRFSALSPEFVAAVGPAAGDVLGLTFNEAALRLSLDPSGEIANLLDRRDTWSGRSVLWPIAGTDLKIPVDLAALPVYSRDRTFEGFRGFGVARLADVMMDPLATGLTLGSDSTIEAFSAASAGLVEGIDEERAPPADPFEGETPALSVAPQPDRRFSDKIIRLAEHRPPGIERSLSPVEKVAFREIGDRLKTVVDTDRETPAQSASAQPSNEATDVSGIASAEIAAPAAPGEEPAPYSPSVHPVEDAAKGDQAAEPEKTERDTLTADLFDAVPNSHDDPVADASAAAAQAATGSDDLEGADAEPPESPEAGDEPYNPSNCEGWSDLTPPVEQARQEAAEAELAEHEADPVDASAEPYPGGGEAEEAAIGTFSHLVTEADGKLDSAADADALADIDGVEAARGAASNDEGGSEPTPPVAEAPVEADATEIGEPSRPVMDPPGEPPHPEPADPAVTESADARVEEPYAPSNFEGWSELTPLVREALEEAEDAETAEHEAEPIDAPVGPYPAGASTIASVEPEATPGTRPQDTTILARLPVPILIHSGDALHYANDEFLELTGYASVETLARAGGLGVLFADRYSDGETDETSRSLRLRTADGENFPIEALLRAVPWQGARALMLVVRRTGDTDLPLAPPVLEVGERDELRARISEMRTIIDTATDGVILIDPAGAIRSVSRPAEALFGYESDELEGKPFVSLFAIESQRAARDYLGGLSDNGVASVLNDGREVIGREAAGRFIPLFMSVGRLPNATGFCAVVRDLTQWKRAEEELTHARSLAERASSQKTDFLARISHEIRTPLNAIIGFSELMMDERFGSIGNERYRDYLRDINRSGNHVLDLVNDLLDISKIEAGEQEMAHEAVSLNETLGQSVAMMQPQANRERVIIRSSLASRLPDVVADLRSIRQIALNLLSNAIRYTQAGGQVIVSTAYEPTGEVVMRIRDTGIGMTQAEIEQALKPFKQINALKRTRGDGTGLGLPLTKAMVEANRARFFINSTPGEGTMVEVTFPSTRVLAH